MLEEWKDYPRNKKYMVSTYGKVLSKARTGSKGGLLKLQEKKSGGSGYLMCCTTELTERGYINKLRPVHRMVLETFDRYANEGEECNHIDGNRANNHISNLEWCTRKENIHHSFKIMPFEKRNLNRTPVIAKINGKIVGKYPSVNEAARQTGGNASAISACIKGKYKQSGGFIWQRQV